jgi:L-rhamnose isomerase
MRHLAVMVGAADPFQLFRIMIEIVLGGGLDPSSGVAFRLDQCHLGIDPDPIAAYRRSGHFDKVRAERVGGGAAGWGA